MKKLLKWIGYIIGSILAIPLVVFILKFLTYLLLIIVSVSFGLLGVEEEEKEVYSFEIEAIKDHNTYVTSRYGGGDNQLRYYFIREIDDEKIIGHTKVNESTIIEDGGSKVVVYVNVPKILPNLYLKLAKFSSVNGNEYEFVQRKYKYHIPVGSIEYEYDIDME